MTMRLIYLFAGVEAVLAASGELRDPARIVPRGVLGGLGLATLIYLGTQFAAQGILGPALPSHTQAPLADVGRRARGCSRAAWMRAIVPTGSARTVQKSDLNSD